MLYLYLPCSFLLLLNTDCWIAWIFHLTKYSILMLLWGLVVVFESISIEIMLKDSGHYKEANPVQSHFYWLLGRTLVWTIPWYHFEGKYLKCFKRKSRNEIIVLWEWSRYQEPEVIWVVRLFTSKQILQKTALDNSRIFCLWAET